jgi:hypothetical protein
LPFRELVPAGPQTRPPWTVEDHNGACFIVKDRGGQALAYVYYEEEPVGDPRQICSLVMRRGE